jgi:hypothetical protein
MGDHPGDEPNEALAHACAKDPLPDRIGPVVPVRLRLRRQVVAQRHVGRHALAGVGRQTAEKLDGIHPAEPRDRCVLELDDVVLRDVEVHGVHLPCSDGEQRQRRASSGAHYHDAVGSGRSESGDLRTGILAYLGEEEPVLARAFTGDPADVLSVQNPIRGESDGGHAASFHPSSRAMV